MRALPLINMTFAEQTSHHEKNTYKAFTFSMIHFDPYKQITADNEITSLRRREKAPTVFSEIFLTEKSSYFMMRTQLVNCMCQLKEPSQQAVEVIEQTILMFEQSDADSEETDRFLKHKIRKLIIEEHGEDFTKDYMFDAESLQAITNNLMRLFCHVLFLKIGAEEITKDRVTERLVINSSMRVTTHSNIRNGTWFMDIRVSLDQYHPVQDWKSLFGNTSRQAILAEHLELPNHLSGQPDYEQKKIEVSHKLSLKVVDSDHLKGPKSDNVANMAAYEKWTGKFKELMEHPWFSERREDSQVNEYIRAMMHIKAIIRAMIQETP